MGVGPLGAATAGTAAPAGAAMAASATAGNSPPSWKLADPINALTQGLVASGFADLPFGRALFLEFVWEPGVTGGAWLSALANEVEITHGAPSQKQPRAAALAFSWTGLKFMGLGEQALASFSRPFREGMFQEDRLRRLGDRRKRKWCKTVISGGPAWSANTPLKDPTLKNLGWTGGYDVPHDNSPEEEVRTPVTVHALLLLYTDTEADAKAWSDRIKERLAEVHVRTVRELELLLDVEKQSRISREHFGFADGLSQPVPYGLSEPVNEAACVLVDGKPAPKDPIQGVPLGEILIGYQNGHSEPAPGPVVPRQIDGDPNRTDPLPREAGLPDHREAEGFADLGINGSYLVVRELKQDVAAFWKSLDANADRINKSDPSAQKIDAEWLAERVVGRGLDGHLLCPGGYLKADQDNLPDSGFVFGEHDPHGFGCPPGSHVRRAFPRDALARPPKPKEKERDRKQLRQEALQAANNHRILRRGRKYGPKIANDRVADGADRGLLFMCLNTDIERQFEFVQQTWLLNSNFATLFEEVDPLIGPAGPQTIRGEPMRRTVQVDTFIQMAGGDYFFLPSMQALKYLSLL